MSELNRKSFLELLSPIAHVCVLNARDHCMERVNDMLEIEHIVREMLLTPKSDFARIVQHFGLDLTRLETDLVASLDELPRSHTRRPGIAMRVDNLLERSYVFASVACGESRIRTAHFTLALLKTPALRDAFLGLSSEFEKIDEKKLVDSLAVVTAGSEELVVYFDRAASGTVAPVGRAASSGGGSGALDRFTVDLTEKVRKGGGDPIIGRDPEIRRSIDVLMRRFKNNPILTGEAGVGKTAVVEGLAQRIVAKEVPPALQEVSLLTLDLGSLQAGASMKGEFEQRLRNIIQDVQASPKPIILFIDEIHTLIGAGGQAGAGDAANLLKPALARGQLRTIGATTNTEYKMIEKDPALARRFEEVKVDEPDELRCIRMLRAVATGFEKHHRVRILDEAIDAAVRLSHRYIPARQLPDKAVSLIDTASARVGNSQHAVPAEVDDRRQEIRVLSTEIDILLREKAEGTDHAARLEAATARLEKEKATLKEFEDRWAGEKALVTRIVELRTKLTAASVAAPVGGAAPAVAAPGDSVEAQQSELRAKEQELKRLQGDSPLVFPCVGAEAIATVIAESTGIPVGRMMRDEIQQVLTLADALEKRVVGQRSALDTIARRVQASRARVDNPNRPVGVFMLVGPSGTGKTETALALAEALYGGERNIISINMSEFQEAHTVSTLKGSPRGYVGYGEGGTLTEAVRRRPYSVVLLDEIEKAHKDVHEIFFQVFDKGWMEDTEGRVIDFKNTIILLTSNAAQEVIIKHCEDPDLMPTPEALEKLMRDPLKTFFPDALLNRLLVVPYYPISREMLRAVIQINLRRVEKRVRENYNVPFTWDAAVSDLIAQRCTELERGARMVDALVTNSLLPEIGREILGRLANEGGIKRVHVGVAEGRFTFAFD